MAMAFAALYVRIVRERDDLSIAGLHGPAPEFSRAGHLDLDPLASVIPAGACVDLAPGMIACPSGVETTRSRARRPLTSSADPVEAF